MISCLADSLRAVALLLLCTSTGCIQRASCAAGSSSPACSAQRPPEQSAVKIDLAARHQSIEGFGASLAWYQNLLVHHSRKAEIYPLLFRELGLDVLRFRNRYERSRPEDLSEDVEVLERATESLGRRPKLLLTSWSPPAGLKASGREDCAGNSNCTLRKSGGKFDYAGFAAYWHDSLRHYQGLGMAPDYASIQNEPSFVPSSWEGCKFEPAETADYPGYDRALEAVHERLAGLEDAPRLVGPEVLGVHWDRPRKYLRAMNLELVSAMAHHLYESGPDQVWDWRDPGPDSFNDELRATARLAGGRPIFQTEFNTDEDQGIEGGFETAWLIHNSLVEEGVAMWLYWELVWPNNKGLVSLAGSRFKIRDQYYSLKHYAYFTDPGDVRVEAASSHPDVRASAYLSPDRRRLSVVLLNVGERVQHVALQLSEPVGSAAEAYRTVYRPGKSETWVNLGQLPASMAVALPPRSVATVVFR